MNETLTPEQFNGLKNMFLLAEAIYFHGDRLAQSMGKPIQITEMRKLHNLALSELEKENPSMEIIIELVKQMEELANYNSQPKPNFKKGAI